MQVFSKTQQHENAIAGSVTKAALYQNDNRGVKYTQRPCKSITKQHRNIT